MLHAALNHPTYNTDETSHYYYLVCVHVLNPVLVGEHVFGAKNLVEMLQNFFFYFVTDKLDKLTRMFTPKSIFTQV